MKQLTHSTCLSDEKIEKLIYSGNEGDYTLGVSFLIKKYAFVEETPTNLDYFHFRKGGTEVYKFTGNLQIEIVIGQTGFIVRDIRKVDCDYDMVKKHWR